MVEASRFTLTELIEVGPVYSRYRGSLPNVDQAEICVFRTSSEKFEEGDGNAGWWRRLRLAKLLQSPNCLRLLELDEQHDPPFAAFPSLSCMSLADAIQDSKLIEREIEILARNCTEALVACEEIGLVVGGLTLQSVFRNATGEWLVDVSSLRSPIFGGVNGAQPYSFIAPELLQSIPGVSPAELCDRAADIYSLAALLRHAIETCNLKHHLGAKNVWSATADCLASEPLARPTAKELLKRLQVARSLQMTSDSDAASNGDFEVTMNVSGEIKVPIGFLAEGTQLGRYTICEKLGEGGMGSVYRARDAADGRTVAIKILNKQVEQDSLTARRFAKEARLLAKANNPYVANLYEVNSDATLPYMVVEFVEGGTLGSLIKVGQAFDEHFCLAVIADAVRGLAIAHARGVVHRDFKPDNVLLTKETRTWIATNSPYATADRNKPRPAIGKIFAKVSDFGLARTSQQSESMAMTREGALMGTPLYMSPEQCRGEAAGAETDVYSVGITLFQLLSGRPPFDADSQVGLLYQHCNAVPPSLKQLRPLLSDALVRTIEKCLAKNPMARYSDAGELLVDLENILRGDPTSLGLHPPILALNEPDVMRFEHSWNLESSASQLWPYVSNTDRVNHAIGLPAVTYTTRTDPVHGVQRFAEATILRQRIRWQEHPYEWIEGRRLSVLREFTHGPFHWFVNVVELQPITGGGTRIVQTLIVAPRNWVGKQLAKLQLGKKSKAGFGRAYEQIDRYISQSQTTRADSDPFVGRTELRTAQRQKLQVRLAQLRECNVDPLVVDTLAQFLEHASDLEVARLRPLAFAERFQLNAEQVVTACLEATRLGILSLMWDILCPSCKIPANIQETLAAIKDHGFCEACNLNFAVDLADSVEMIFRVHPELRDVQTATYCIGGPAWSRHVVAQVRLAAGERFACDLNLTEGAYVVRGPQLPFTIDIRVGHTNGLRRIELSLARPLENSRIHLPTGSQVILLCNDSASDQQIRIERAADRHDAFSAAKASTIGLFRELFPSEVLSSDQIVSVAHITLVRIKLVDLQQSYESLGDGPAFHKFRTCLDQALRIVRENSGAVVKTIGEGVMASFSDPLQAMRAAMKLIDNEAFKDWGVSIAVNSGAAMVATLDDRLDYFGKMLKSLEQLIDSAPLGTIHTTASVTELPEVRSMLEAQQIEIQIATNLKLLDGNIPLCLQQRV